MIAAGLVFIMHLGFATPREPVSPGPRTRSTSCSRTRSSCAHRHPDLRPDRLQSDVPRRLQRSVHRLRRASGSSRVDGGPDTGSPTPMRRLHLLDRLPLPGDVRGHRRDDRLGRGRGAHQARVFMVFSDCSTSPFVYPIVPGHGSGAAAGSMRSASTTSRARHSCTRVGGWGALAGAFCSAHASAST